MHLSNIKFWDRATRVFTFCTRSGNTAVVQMASQVHKPKSVRLQRKGDFDLSYLENHQLYHLQEVEFGR